MGTTSAGRLAAVVGCLWSPAGCESTGGALPLASSRYRVCEDEAAREALDQARERIARGAHAELRNSMPGVSIVQVVHVSDDNAVTEALRAAREVDALLLDSGNPSLRTKELGGTGRTHDWSLSPDYS